MAFYLDKRMDGFPPKLSDMNLEIGSGGQNNCLFEAAIAACSIVSADTMLPYDPQKLRDMCDEILRGEEMPLFPKGTPAGGQYIQALSKILMRTVSVYVCGEDQPEHTADVTHSAIYDMWSGLKSNVENFSILHSGSLENGHWEALEL